MGEFYTGSAAKMGSKPACPECEEQCIHSAGQRKTLRKRLAKKLNAEIIAREDQEEDERRITRLFRG